MKKITVTLYRADNGVRFVEKEGGGFITLIDPEAITVTSRNLFTESKQALDEIPGISKEIQTAYAELAEFMKDSHVG